jgi:hypothetical protein
LQQEIDVWSEDWIAICGREGMTNCRHILARIHSICIFYENGTISTDIQMRDGNIKTTESETYIIITRKAVGPLARKKGVLLKSIQLDCGI